MNNDQIVSSVSDGVYRAVASAMSRYGNSNEQGDIIINIDGNEVFEVIRKKDNEYRKRTGRGAFVH